MVVVTYHWYDTFFSFNTQSAKGWHWRTETRSPDLIALNFGLWHLVSQASDTNRSAAAHLRDCVAPAALEAMRESPSLSAAHLVVWHGATPMARQMARMAGQGETMTSVGARALNAAIRGVLELTRAVVLDVDRLVLHSGLAIDDPSDGLHQAHDPPGANFYDAVVDAHMLLLAS